MAAKKQPTVHPSDLPWYKQTPFLVAVVIIALLVGMHSRPNDSDASIAPSPTLETPAPVIEPAPIATPPAPVVVQAPAPTPPAPVTVVNVIGQDTKAAPQIIRELQPIIYRQSTPPEPAEPSPSPEHKTTARSEHCEQMLAEHNRRVEEMRATLRSYHP